MLTLDLIDTRMYRGEVRPRYVQVESAEQVDVASQLIEVFDRHLGATRGELRAALGELSGSGTDYRFRRALAKLLFDRSRFEIEGALDPVRAREAVFAEAAHTYRHDGGEREKEGTAIKWSFERSKSLEAAAKSLDVSVEELERSLYADLKDEQRVVEFRGCTPAWLLGRYNVALAQGVVLRATELLIDFRAPDPRQLRELVHKIKFFRLLHRIRGTESGYQIRLDGPLSVFKASGRYGFQMASFLPSILHFDEWHMTASVRWGKPPKPRSFSLDPGRGLKPINVLRGQWRIEELDIFRDRFEALASEWRVVDRPRLIELGGGDLVVSDFEFRREGRKPIALEVLGFWRRGSVARRLEQMHKSHTRQLLIAIGRSFAAGAADPDYEDDPRLIVFRRTLLPKRVLAALNRLSESS